MIWEEGMIASGGPNTGVCQDFLSLTIAVHTDITEWKMPSHWRSMRPNWLFLPASHSIFSSDKIRQFIHRKGHRQLTSAAEASSIPWATGMQRWNNIPAASHPICIPFCPFQLNEFSVEENTSIWTDWDALAWAVKTQRSHGPNIIICQLVLSQPGYLTFPFLFILTYSARSYTSNLTSIHLCSDYLSIKLGFLTGFCLCTA